MGTWLTTPYPSPVCLYWWLPWTVALETRLPLGSVVAWVAVAIALAGVARPWPGAKPGSGETCPWPGEEMTGVITWALVVRVSRVPGVVYRCGHRLPG